MVKQSLAGAAVLACLVGCGQTTEELGGSHSQTLSKQDNEFFKQIAEGNMTEIQSSQMALQMSSNPQVKDFAQHMINDHTLAGTQVQSVAMSKDVKTPTQLDDTHKDLMSTLNGKSGMDFDKAYLDLQVKAHQATINADQDEADNGNDPDVKNLANTLLPTLKSHLSEVQKIQGGMM